MIEVTELGERFLAALEELGSKAETTRPVTVKPKSHGFALINPVDWRRNLIISVYFDVWSTPSPGKDGDFVGWNEQWLFVERRNQWMRVVRIENSSDNTVDMTVRISAS